MYTLIHVHSHTCTDPAIHLLELKWWYRFCDETTYMLSLSYVKSNKVNYSNGLNNCEFRETVHVAKGKYAEIDSRIRIQIPNCSHIIKTVVMSQSLAIDFAVSMQSHKSTAKQSRQKELVLLSLLSVQSSICCLSSRALFKGWENNTCKEVQFHFNRNEHHHLLSPEIC